LTLLSRGLWGGSTRLGNKSRIIGILAYYQRFLSSLYLTN
jgi:hypothetical protein